MSMQLTSNITSAGLVVATMSIAVACEADPRSRTAVDASLGADATVADAGTPDTALGADATAAPDVVISSDSAPADCMDVVDVVFVLDLSSSMRFVLQQLADDVVSVVNAAIELAPNPQFGFVGFTDNHAFAEVSGSKIHTDASTLSAAFNEFQRLYTDADRNPGDGPTGPTRQNPICEENSLDALYAAAADYPWRPSATRVIILATDDTFLESPDNYGDRDADGRTDRTDFPREGDYPALHNVAETVSLLQDQRVRVFAFARTMPPGPFELTGRCGTGRRLPESSMPDGWFSNYGSNAPIPEATDGRAYDVIQVRNGQLNLADTIAEVVVESYCHPPLI